MFAIALSPPDLLIWLNLFAFGGLQSAFIWPVIMGLYWQRGNEHGALASMIVGSSSYIIIHNFAPNMMGVHSVVFPILFSLIAFVLVSFLTENASFSSTNKLHA